MISLWFLSIYLISIRLVFDLFISVQETTKMRWLKNKQKSYLGGGEYKLKYEKIRQKRLCFHQNNTALILTNT